jgi:hypothetical protein
MILPLDRPEGFTNGLVLALAPSAYVSEGLLAEHRFARLMVNRTSRRCATCGTCRTCLGLVAYRVSYATTCRRFIDEMKSFSIAVKPAQDLLP